MILPASNKKQWSIQNQKNMICVTLWYADYSQEEMGGLKKKKKLWLTKQERPDWDKYDKLLYTEFILVGVLIK